MRGDVLFWTPGGDTVSRLVADLTHGPFCHVSVDMGDGTDIGAHSDGGVAVRHVPDSRGITRVPIVQLLISQNLSQREEDARIESAITLLKGEVGDKYGWCNIVNAGLNLLHLPYRINRVDRYDCSSLVTRYLAWVGVWLGDFSEEPDSVSPNDLARALKVI